MPYRLTINTNSCVPHKNHPDLQVIADKLKEMGYECTVGPSTVCVDNASSEDAIQITRAHSKWALSGIFRLRKKPEDEINEVSELDQKLKELAYTCPLVSAVLAKHGDFTVEALYELCIALQQSNVELQRIAASYMNNAMPAPIIMQKQTHQ